MTITTIMYFYHTSLSGSDILWSPDRSVTTHNSVELLRGGVELSCRDDVTISFARKPRSPDIMKSTRDRTRITDIETYTLSSATPYLSLLIHVVSVIVAGRASQSAPSLG